VCEFLDVHVIPMQVAASALAEVAMRKLKSSYEDEHLPSPLVLSAIEVEQVTEVNRGTCSKIDSDASHRAATHPPVGLKLSAVD